MGAVGLITGLAAAGFATAAAAQGLPGGATALTETYRDWQVNCVTRAEATRCALVQQQSNPQTRERIIAAELLRDGDGLAGTFIVPFGLDLEAGVALRVDADPPDEPALRFSTCLPAGCLLPVRLQADRLQQLRSGNRLRLTARAHGGQPIEFALSLLGFTTALARLSDLP